MTDLKLGKQPAEHRPTDLHLLKVIGPDGLKEAPIGFGHRGVYPLDWGMLGNDRYGNCVFAGADHETELWNAINGKRVSFTSANALHDYAAVTGFDPKDPSSDQGTVVQDALSYRRHVGVIDAAGYRHKVGAYVSLEPGDWHQLLEALNAFDLVGIGFNFPASAMDQFNRGEPWHYIGDQNIEGGHYVPVVGRPHVSTISTVTWGQLQSMTRKFMETYVDEAFGILSLESLNASGVTAEGLNLDKLKAALAAL